MKSSAILEQPMGGPPLTLAGVLYREARAPVPEEEWASLVRAIAGRDRAALYALYDRAHRLVFTLALRLTANRQAAEEITLDVFHDIWRRAGSYRPGRNSVLGWIMNRARARAIGRLRLNSARNPARQAGLETPAEEADPADVARLREDERLIRSALGALSPDERQAIETSFFGGLSVAQAAARLGRPAAAVRAHIRSGLAKLRQGLEAEGNAP